MIRRHPVGPPDNQRLAHLCGPLDAHLRRIEAALAVKLARRDEVFRIEGAREAVERAEALLDALYEQAAAPLGETVLERLIAGQDGADAGGAPIVLHTRHTDLAGRTPNQVQYLRQMLGHDITFGIGPAGTGKTFLAVACAV
ncbi:MAG: PhoH family protein, partial [Burkholderiales bacterium]|nr:PhoH family protein [Burkholderiales bacterium]